MLAQLLLALVASAAPNGAAAATRAPHQDSEDLSCLGLHALVARIPRSGESSWTNDPATGRLGLVPPLAELRRRLASGATLELDDWRTILLEKGYLRWRRRWPIEEPFAISLHLPALEQGLRVELVPRLAGWGRARASHWERMCGLGMQALRDEEDYQVLGKLPADASALEFDLVPELAVGAGKGRRPALARTLGPIRIEVQPVATLDEVLERRSDDLPGRELRRALELVWRPDGTGPGRAWLWARTGWRSLAASVDAHLERGARSFPSTRLVLHEARMDPAVRLEGLPAEIALGRRCADGWTLHLRGVPAGVLRDWDATSYWAGAIEVPLSELIRRDAPPNPR